MVMAVVVMTVMKMVMMVMKMGMTALASVCLECVLKSSPRVISKVRHKQRLSHIPKVVERIDLIDL